MRNKAPVGAVGLALWAKAAAHHAALVALVNAGAASPRHREAWSEDLRHEFEERAAILTFEVGMARIAAGLEAERLVSLLALATFQPINFSVTLTWWLETVAVHFAAAEEPA
jgi:hypothetical protein